MAPINPDKPPSTDGSDSAPAPAPALAPALAPAQVASIGTNFPQSLTDTFALASFGHYFLPDALHIVTQSTMIGGRHFNPEKEIPDLSGKVILVTGGNTGLGQETVLQISKHKPSQIYLAARTASKAEQAIKEIKATVPDAPITHIPLDLTSFESIASCAKTFTSQSSRLDILFNNAGVMAMPVGHTKEGYEIQFGTNHMGHFLLTKLLLPTLLKTAELPDADVRIINNSSVAHNFAPSGHLVTDAKEQEKLNTWVRYGVSKLANILHARELAKRYPSITAVSIHPGVIKTNLYSSASQSNFIMMLGIGLMGSVGSLILPDVPTGAKNQLWCATTAKSDVQNGKYYTPIGHVKKLSRVEISDRLAEELWTWSAKEVEAKGY